MSSSRGWMYRGFSARLGDENEEGPSSSSQLVVDLGDDDFPPGQPEPSWHDPSVQDTTATDLESLRTVAYSWLVDASIELSKQLRAEIEDKLFRMTMVMTGTHAVLIANATCISMHWQRLRGVIGKLRNPGGDDADAAKTDENEDEDEQAGDDEDAERLKRKR